MSGAGLRGLQCVEGAREKRERGGDHCDGGGVASLLGWPGKISLGWGLLRNLSHRPCVQPCIHSPVWETQGETQERAVEEATVELTLELGGGVRLLRMSLRRSRGLGPWLGKGAQYRTPKAGNNPCQLAFGSRQHYKKKERKRKEKQDNYYLTWDFSFSIYKSGLVFNSISKAHGALLPRASALARCPVRSPWPGWPFTSTTFRTAARKPVPAASRLDPELVKYSHQENVC